MCMLWSSAWLGNSLRKFSMTTRSDSDDSRLRSSESIAWVCSGWSDIWRIKAVGKITTAHWENFGWGTCLWSTELLLPLFIEGSDACSFLCSCNSGSLKRTAVSNMPGISFWIIGCCFIIASFSDFESTGGTTTVLPLFRDFFCCNVCYSSL